MKKIACFATIAVCLFLLVAVNGCDRAASTAPDTVERLAELERELRELKERGTEKEQTPEELKGRDQIALLLEQNQDAMMEAVSVLTELRQIQEEQTSILRRITEGKPLNPLLEWLAQQQGEQAVQIGLLLETQETLLQRMQSSPTEEVVVLAELAERIVTLLQEQQEVLEAQLAESESTP